MKSNKILFYTLIIISFLILTNDTQAQTNLAPNPSLEAQSASGMPANWSKGKWGTNTAVFTYPVAGIAGDRAAKVELTSRTSGDAKWYFNEISVKPNTEYTFSNKYKSNISSWITVQYRLSDGTYRWVDIANPGPSTNWNLAQGSFTTPSNVAALTIFHLINRVGSLTVDDYYLRETSAAPTASNGLLTFNFDDGWITTHENAMPILARSGVKASFYITSRFTFPAYINESQVLEIQAQGHEVGSHTRNHVSLVGLSESELNNEVHGNILDLKQLGIRKIETFAYPFGAYNDTTDTFIKSAGFIGARTSDGGYNSSSVSEFKLRRQNVGVNESISQIRAWIDQAIANDEWLILVFHRVDNSGTLYSTTPQNLEQIIDYAKSRSISIVTTAEGMRRIY